MRQLWSDVLQGSRVDVAPVVVAEVKIVCAGEQDYYTI